MKIAIPQESFLQSLSLVSKGVSSKNTLEILKGILIETYEGKLLLTSNNLELGIQTLMDDVEILEEGRIVIDARLLTDIVKRLPNQILSIQTDEYQVVNIKADQVEFNIKGFEATDFPLPATISEEHYREMDADVFRDMIKKTSFAVAPEGDKPAYTGELLDIQEQTIHMVAMDGFRLAIQSYQTSSHLHQTKILIPGRSLLEVSRMIGPSQEFLKLGFDEKHACFIIGDTIVTTRLLKNDFINYEQIIPKEFSTHVRMKKDDLLSSLERATLVSNKNLIKFQIEDDNLNISSKNDEVGNLNENVSIHLTGENLEIAFNAKFFIDCLKNLEEEEILLKFNSPLSPCIIQPLEDENYTYLVLPVRI